MMFTSEIYFTKQDIQKDEWIALINAISNYHRLFKNFKIIVSFRKNVIQYYIITHCTLPSVVNSLDSFLLKPTASIEIPKSYYSYPFINSLEDNAIDLFNYYKTKKKKRLEYIEIDIFKLSYKKIVSIAKVYYKKQKHFICQRLFFSIPASILTLNFQKNKHFFYRSVPKYLDISKCMHLFTSHANNSILRVDTFPYLQGSYYLEQKRINFAKHSIIFGSSGCGKSKFLSSLIYNIYKNDIFCSQYKIVVIDPHASLEDDIGGLGKVIDFKSDKDSINLFSNNHEDVIVSVELLLDVFKGLISNNYNSKLERVLRHSLYLLLMSENFHFQNLRRLLLEMDYRNSLVNQYTESLPTSIIGFFLSEFNEIKTKSYTEAISPIIAFIDELEMIPVFNKSIESSNLKETINSEFLTLFSLDRTKLGDKVTKTISGLIMQQMLTLVQNHSFSEHIIFIVDEVAVVENPILNRFLSEARKYHLSLILAGQYFGGITEKLRKSIFANVINYYMFRISKDDANILVDNFNMKVPLDDTRERKVKIMTELQDRECIIRINSDGVLLPTMKCRTLDFKSIPRIKSVNSFEESNIQKKNAPSKTNFSSCSNINLKDILISNSTSRKVVK